MSGTDIAYGAVRYRLNPLIRRTDIAYGAGPTPLIRDVRYWHSTWCRALSAYVPHTRCPYRYRLCCYAVAMRCPVLTSAVPMRFPTPLRGCWYCPSHPATRLLRAVRYPTTRLLCTVRYPATSLLASVLRFAMRCPLSCYAFARLCPGPTWSRPCYAMPGTDVAYDMSSTNDCYAATNYGQCSLGPCGVLT
eukprot:2330352-Rhodomonas_salina.2